jgi:hypothetical protein
MPRHVPPPFDPPGDVDRLAEIDGILLRLVDSVSRTTITIAAIQRDLSSARTWGEDALAIVRIARARRRESRS